MEDTVADIIDKVSRLRQSFRYVFVEKKSHDTETHIRMRNVSWPLCYFDDWISSFADFRVVSVIVAPPRSLAISCTFSSAVSSVIVVYVDDSSVCFSIL